MDKSASQRFLLTTFGCQMNLADGQRIRGILQRLGYDETENEADADLILFNTCCVREHAEERLFSRVQSLKRLKAGRPELIIGVTGCLAQHHKKRLFEELPLTDFIFGPNDIEELPAILAALIAEPGRRRAGSFADVGHFAGEEADGIVLDRPFSAFVNIIRGCTNFCTYCIVPSVRGPEVSRPIHELIGLVTSLAARGVTEVTLLGQNVNAYGRDIGLADGFPRLLEELESVSGLRRIRFLTSHPRDFSAETIGRIARLSKVCESFHLPVQAGADRVLSLMNRGYTREYYLELLATVRELIPGVSITTDLICGFPSETDSEFEETLDLVRRARFDTAYMYYYSPRSGTKALDIAGLLPEEIRKERLARLIELQNSISQQISAELPGKKFEILVESVSTHGEGHVVGKTRTGRPIDLAGPASLVGNYVTVLVERARLWTLSGRLLQHDVEFEP
ncbi:MAG: tRNA (N6-isopentenyl adenosine(37)-C2)-methylthiotransferase MiaB [Candidatus Riflebacteria bacterium]|nr:tRNA (N6-isopentenyl adenosine(37)-C2)-methylthiotransferase MiaB [Candidatus Riflebacteria bacterium]